MAELKMTLVADLNNPEPGDLWLNDGGDAEVTTVLAEEVAQRLHVRFRFFRGEFFLDLTEGTPWFERIFVKAPPDRVIRSVLSSVIRGTEGVAELTQLSYEITKTRQLLVNFRAKLVDGSNLSTQTFGPFVVEIAS